MLQIKFWSLNLDLCIAPISHKYGSLHNTNFPPLCVFLIIASFLCISRPPIIWCSNNYSSTYFVPFIKTNILYFIFFTAAGLSLHRFHILCWPSNMFKRETIAMYLKTEFSERDCLFCLIPIPGEISQRISPFKSDGGSLSICPRQFLEEQLYPAIPELRVRGCECRNPRTGI